MSPALDENGIGANSTNTADIRMSCELEDVQKTCRHCDGVFDADHFYVKERTRNGRVSVSFVCRDHAKRRSREWNEANPQRVKAASRKKYERVKASESPEERALRLARNRAAAAAARERDPEIQRAAVRASYRKWKATATPEQIRNRLDRPSRLAWLEANLDKVREYRRAFRLNKMYGLTPESWGSLLDSQGGVCACCGGGNGGRPWHTDHCHDTGRVRGILCQKCNVGIGAMGDRIDAVRSFSSAAIRYLEKPWA